MAPTLWHINFIFTIYIMSSVLTSMYFYYTPTFNLNQTIPQSTQKSWKW